MIIKRCFFSATKATGPYRVTRRKVSPWCRNMCAPTGMRCQEQFFQRLGCAQFQPLAASCDEDSRQGCVKHCETNQSFASRVCAGTIESLVARVLESALDSAGAPDSWGVSLWVCLMGTYRFFYILSL